MSVLSVNCSSYPALPAVIVEIPKEFFSIEFATVAPGLLGMFWEMATPLSPVGGALSSLKVYSGFRGFKIGGIFIK